MDNFGNIPYVRRQDNLEHEIVDGLEWTAFFLFLGWVIHRIRVGHHYVSGIVLLISSVAAILVMVSLDMASDAAYVFWFLVGVAFVSLAKAVS